MRHSGGVGFGVRAFCADGTGVRSCSIPRLMALAPFQLRRRLTTSAHTSGHCGVRRRARTAFLRARDAACRERACRERASWRWGAPPPTGNVRPPLHGSSDKLQRDLKALGPGCVAAEVIVCERLSTLQYQDSIGCIVDQLYSVYLETLSQIGLVASLRTELWSSLVGEMSDSDVWGTPLTLRKFTRKIRKFTTGRLLRRTDPSVFIISLWCFVVIRENLMWLE